MSAGPRSLFAAEKVLGRDEAHSLARPLPLLRQARTATGDHRMAGAVAGEGVNLLRAGQVS